MAESWEDQVDDTKLIVRKRDDRWEGEDEEDVKDNWDDEDDQEEDKSTGSEGTAKLSTKKKVPLAVRIAEREEKRKRELEEKKRVQMEEGPKTAEDILAAKLEQQRLQEESDLLIAQEAFGVEQTKTNDVFSKKLVTKEDFDEFRKNLVNKFNDVSKSTYYIDFLEATIREISVSLEADDIKKISNSLNALFNEKIKSQKTTKGKKKKGTSIKIEKNIASEYGEYDEFDEFM